MKKQILTSILIILWAGLFSQESIIQLNAGNLAGIRHPDMTGNKASFKSYNPSNFEDYIANWAQGANVPGLSVCVLKNGKLYWVHHYGLANIAENIPVNDSSVFYLASVSKTVVQTACMQLWELDIFELTDTVSNYLSFPVFNPYYPDIPITFFQLMTHTSSISSNYIGGIPIGQFMPGFFTPGGPYYSTANFLGTAPGTLWSYSNVGNALLGYLTQVMADQDFGEYCTEHIFQPLGINEGSYYLADIDPEHLVTQYIYSGGTYYPTTTPDGGGSIYPAGGLKMSAIELSKFLGMYMQQGTFNGSTILSPETVELITTPTSWDIGGWFPSKQCLTWDLREDMNMTYHTGGTNFSSTFAGYDRDDQWGAIILMNVGIMEVPPWVDIIKNLPTFASLYNPISVISIALNDADGDGVIEANEEFELGLTLRNDSNFPDVPENITATISVNSPYLNLISDSIVSLGTLNYLDEIQLPDDQFQFAVGSYLERGNIEFQLHFSWEGGKEYTKTFSLFGGLADVLLVRDETGSPDPTQDWYLRSLDSLGYLTQFYDLELMGDLSSVFINNFPAVIWFTGGDAENTVSESNQSLLAGYLDGGGNLFMSGQNISDELAGTDFLTNYLLVEHLEDYTNANYIVGIVNDPIGNGQQYVLTGGDALTNQFSKSVVGPLAGASMAFKYLTTELKGAAIRYSNLTYKTVFFAFGFEAINGFENRTEILYRILNDYFQVIVSDEDDESMSETTGTGLHVFPNPLGQRALIDYILKNNSPVTLKILDLSGREVETLVNEVQLQGEQRVVFNTKGIKPGIYFCVIKTSEGVQTKKMIKL